MGDPTPKVIVAIVVLAVASFVVLPVMFFLVGLAANCGVLLFSKRFRRPLFTICRIVLIFCVLLLIVGLGRTASGTDPCALLEESLRSLGLALLVLFVASMILVYIDATELLNLLDTLRVPRAFSYLLLSVITSLGYVTAMGKRQLQLLRIKSLGPKGIRGRFSAYYRIVGPLFLVLLNRQYVHSRSLLYRGFFTRPVDNVMSVHLPTISDSLWTLITLGIWSILYLAWQCIWK